MTTMGWIALALTIFGAFAFAAASIFQAIGARRSTGMANTLRHPLYLLGTFLDLLAWGCSMVALSELAVYLVESVLAGSLAVTVVAARVILKSRLRGIDVVAVAVSVVALTVLAMSAGPQETVETSAMLRMAFCGAALLIALLGWVATKFAPPGVVAGFAGLCLGGAALVGRALTFPDGAFDSLGSGVLAVLTSPLIGALLVFGVAGMVLYADALQRGSVGPVTAVLWIAEVIAPSAVAVTFLGDTVRPGWEMASMGAGLIVVVMAVVLATAPATTATVMAADTSRPALEPAPARHARPAAPVPAAPAPAAPRTRSERIIWWGAPPIWVPPERRRPALTGHTAPALSWAPPERQPVWAQPHPSDADSTEIPRPAAPDFPAYPDAPRFPEPDRLRPWHDLPTT
jgi:drug/metabolite transporter (DMT)-like permease